MAPGHTRSHGPVLMEAHGQFFAAAWTETPGARLAHLALMPKDEWRRRAPPQPNARRRQETAACAAVDLADDRRRRELIVPKWTKRELWMDENHGWRCKPGYTIFVADRGAVRFDVPETWVVEADAEGVKIHDKPPPDDNARIQLSIFIPPPVVGWDGLPLATMLADALAGRGREETRRSRVAGPGHPTLLRRDRIDPLADAEEEDDFISQDPITHVLRPNLEIVWTECRRIDQTEQREARSRHLFARGRGTPPGATQPRDILPLVTMDFWPEDAPRCNTVWKELVRSLRVGEYVDDPRRGPES